MTFKKWLFIGATSIALSVIHTSDVSAFQIDDEDAKSGEEGPATQSTDSIFFSDSDEMTMQEYLWLHGVDISSLSE